jgi:uncharacterized Zn finger protein
MESIPQITCKHCGSANLVRSHDPFQTHPYRWDCEDCGRFHKWGEDLQPQDWRAFVDRRTQAIKQMLSWDEWREHEEGFLEDCQNKRFLTVKQEAWFESLYTRYFGRFLPKDLRQVR